MANKPYTKAQACTALSIGFVCVIVGVPLWWKTTQVYRVDLPYSKINTLSHNKIFMLVHAQTISFDTKISAAQLERITKTIQADSSSDNEIVFQYNISSRNAISSEISLYKRSTNLTSLDEALSTVLRGSIDNNHYIFVCLPDDTHIHGDLPFLGSRRLAFIQSSVYESHIETILHDVFSQRKALTNKYESLQRLDNLQLDKESMRMVKASLEYHITFSLVIQDPAEVHVEWDIRRLIDQYITPFTKSLPVSFVIKSQMLSYTGLLAQPQKRDDYFYIDPSALPHMINLLESKLGSHVSKYPSLEFIVYIPSSNHRPLRIVDENDKLVESNSFLSPQWGGILIFNIDTPKGAGLPYKTNLHGDDIMIVFLAQLRLLIGAHVTVPSNVNVAAVYNDGIHDWEVDAFMRSRCLENLSTAKRTIQSLADLLSKIKNIVINDDIGNEVHVAVEHINLAYDSLREGLLYKAFNFAQTAMNASEKAFFDPSLLELLYFPEDQKFAIYVPLFLPISVPIIMSMIQAIKWFKEQRKKRRQKSD